jgi:calcium load-activated calcium channel
MTASDISSLLCTVGICQLIADLCANAMVFQKEPYIRACAQLDRAKWKLDKAAADFAKNQKHAKRHQLAKDEHAEAISNCARRHVGPSLMTSLFFIILLRILGTEHKGEIVAVLPFEPFSMMRRLSQRGLAWQDDATLAVEGSEIQRSQAASFLFLYFLCGLSVKYFVHQAFGTKPPPGADNGLLSMMESPQNKRLLKSMGIDPDELNKPE